MTQALTVILKPGYRADRAVRRRASARSRARGPTSTRWLRSSTTRSPARRRRPRSSRVVEDTFEPLAQLRPAGFSMPFLEALDRGLRVDHKQRPQSIVEFRASLRAGRDTNPRGDDDKRARSSSSYVTYAIMALAVLLLGAIGWRLAHKPTPETVETVSPVHPPAETSPQPPPVVTQPSVVAQPPAVTSPPPVQPRASFSPAGALHEVATTGSAAWHPRNRAPATRSSRPRSRGIFSHCARGRLCVRSDARHRRQTVSAVSE